MISLSLIESLAESFSRAHARAFPRKFKKASTLHNLYYKLSFSVLYVWRLLSSLHTFCVFRHIFCIFCAKHTHFPAIKCYFFHTSNLVSPCFNFHFPSHEFSTPRPTRLYATAVAYIRHARDAYTPRPWRREFFPHNNFIVNTVMLICTL